MYGTSVTRNYIPSDLYGHEREIFYCAFSCLGHGPYIRRSDLANCKFTLVLALIKQAQCMQHWEHDGSLGTRLLSTGTVRVLRRTKRRLQKRRKRGRARYQLNSPTGPAIKEHDKDRLDVLLTDDSENRGSRHCRMEGNSLSYSCRPTSLHDTIWDCLSLFAWICISGLQDLSCYGFIKVF